MEEKNKHKSECNLLSKETYTFKTSAIISSYVKLVEFTIVPFVLPPNKNFQLKLVFDQESTDKTSGTNSSGDI